MSADDDWKLYIKEPKLWWTRGCLILLFCICGSCCTACFIDLTHFREVIIIVQISLYVRQKSETLYNVSLHFNCSFFSLNLCHIYLYIRIDYRQDIALISKVNTGKNQGLIWHHFQFTQFVYTSWAHSLGCCQCLYFLRRSLRMRLK